MKLKISIATFFIILLLSVHAQHSNLRSKVIEGNGKIIIDTLSIVPNSLSITNYDSTFYIIDYFNATLEWKEPTQSDSIEVTYRVMPKLNVVRQNFDYNNYIDVRFPRDKVVASSPDRSVLSFGNLDYNGSFGRNLSFGNNQDLIFNSQFNLQMSGYLGDSIRLEAALTDNNLPVQPDGSTQLLNDFDRIFLQFSQKKWQVSLGDIDLGEDQMRFLRFYKRLQGLSYRQQFNIGSIGHTAILNASIAKGKFARNIIVASEGNQGPYKLFGNNNELYMVVLAGTEKVYIDGKLMSRGEDGDYVIDYNLAQISFTPRQMVTKDKRIQVEFEYSDRNYLNSMVYFKDDIQFSKKFKLSVAAYNNADAKSSPINLSLDASKRQFLNSVGDSIHQAFYPFAEETAYDRAKILYKRVDTLINGTAYQAYVYDTDSLLAKYNLYFSQVGANKGNYLPLPSGANGQVFEWIAPINGVPQGSYEPAEFIPSPKKQQLISLRGEYSFNDKTVLLVELAGSNNDVNAFSVKDKNNDKGFAGNIQLHKAKEFRRKNKEKEWYTNLNLEHVQANYAPIERLRQVEFFRDWGLHLTPGAADENLISVNGGIRDKKGNLIDVQMESYTRSDHYSGYRSILTHRLAEKGWRTNAVLNYTHMQDAVHAGYFFRPIAEVTKSFSKWRNMEAGIRYALEDNHLKDKDKDSLINTSFSFEDISSYIRTDNAKANKFSITYSMRTNRLPKDRVMVQTDKSRNLIFATEFLKNIHHNFRFHATYRSLETYETDYFPNQKSQNSFLGRAEYNINEWKGMLIGSLLYETGAGQEQKRAYNYIQVPAGQGQYTWKDYNEDGIAQLNEFEIASFTDEADYIKIFTPTNEFIKANYVQLNYSILLDPYAYFGDKKDRWSKFWSKLNFQSTLQTNKKSLAEKSMDFNPFQGDMADSSLLDLNYIFNNTLSINRLGRVWGIDVSRLSNLGKALLTYGAETRQIKDWTFKGKLNIKTNYTIELQQRTGRNNLFTPFFENRNYEIATHSIAPSITYYSQTRFRAEVGYQYTSMKNAPKYGGEVYISNALNVESKFNAFSNTSLTGRFTYNKINFTGESNSTVGYTMMQGLLPGSNYLWTIDFTKRLLKYLEFTLQYEGRRPSGTHIIHVGRASVRAIL